MDIEDLSLVMRNPRLALNTLINARQKIKFYSHLKEIFFNQPYYWLWSQAKPHTTLIDIGAFIGDTATYFAMNSNIDKIIAYEPHPKTFKILSNNISALPKPIASKIKLKDTPIFNEEVYVSNSTNTITGTNKVLVGGKDSIKATTLGLELKNLKNVIIKSDCEGAEYQIFKNTKDLKNVYAVQLEYHKGYKSLQDFFEKAGLNCTNSSEDDLGYLSALKQL